MADRRLRDRFAHDTPGTIGVEEEVMLLDGETLDLRPDAAAILTSPGPDERFTSELPAAQLEIVLPPLASVDSCCLTTSESTMPPVKEDST